MTENSESPPKFFFFSSQFSRQPPHTLSESYQMFVLWRHLRAMFRAVAPSSASQPNGSVFESLRPDNFKLLLNDDKKQHKLHLARLGRDCQHLWTTKTIFGKANGGGRLCFKDVGVSTDSLSFFVCVDVSLFHCWTTLSFFTLCGTRTSASGLYLFAFNFCVSWPRQNISQWYGCASGGPQEKLLRVISVPPA